MDEFSEEFKSHTLYATTSIYLPLSDRGVFNGCLIEDLMQVFYEFSKEPAKTSNTWEFLKTQLAQRKFVTFKTLLNKSVEAKNDKQRIRIHLRICFLISKLIEQISGDTQLLELNVEYLKEGDRFPVQDFKSIHEYFSFLEDISSKRKKDQN